MSEPTEPTHKRIGLLHRSPTYGPIKVYVPVSGYVSAQGDSVTIAGHTLTEDEMRRGWYDPEAAPSTTP